MKCAFNAAALIALFACAGLSAGTAEASRESLLRTYAREAGLLPVAAVAPPQAPAAVIEVGRALFESKEVSLNGDISCSSCHLDRFGSADGIPVAIGVGGKGEGVDRVIGGGRIVPRNALPFWGRGAIGFNTFFWDGRVERVDDTVRSQFGDRIEIVDPLVVAAHLPLAEIREMLVDDEDVVNLYRHESVDAAQALYSRLTDRVERNPELGPKLASALGVDIDELRFEDIARAIAAFIRKEFALEDTRLHGFVFDSKELSPEEIAGGLLFYGKARCSACHNGPFFSDFSFHAVPFPQASFGRNGFGIDYGRFNVTQNPSDLYKFRTPPLINVALTGPYSHSGSVSSLRDAIEFHFDPLKHIDARTLPHRDRVEFYRRIGAWTDSAVSIPPLGEDEVDSLVAFLHLLSFDRVKPH